MIRIRSAVLFLMFLLPSCWPPVRGQASDASRAVRLAFVAQADGSLGFDTGVLKGKLHSASKALGLTEVVYVPSGMRLDKSPGLLNLYRMFSGSRRFLPDIRDFPSEVRVLENGSARIEWKGTDERPVDLLAVYRWINPTTVDMELTATARADLPAFEAFLSSYTSAPFLSSRIYCRAAPGKPAGDSFLAAEKSLGDWQMAPRSRADVAMITDGRWKNTPNPVEWTMLPDFALPMGIRRDPQSGLSLLFMTLPEECLSVATPQEKDSHYSLYFSLFGRDLPRGATRRTVARLSVVPALDDRQALESWHAFSDAYSVAAQTARREPPRRLLLVTGQDYPGHLWRQTAPVVRSFLEQDPRMAVTVTEDPGMLDSQGLDKYDAVVLHFMNWEQPAPPAAARQRLQQRVREGMGLALLHFACGAFQDWPEFAELAGRAWDPKLRGHDPYRRFEVEIADAEHPITRGLEPFAVVDELYTCLTGSRPIHVLAKARSQVDGKDYPMAFTLEYGKGKVFHSVLGHDSQALSTPGASALLRRGIAWAAGLPPR